MEQIGDLTDSQIEELYLPLPKKEEKPSTQTPYERFRNVWLRRGKPLDEVNRMWEEHEKQRNDAARNHGRAR